MSFLHVLIYIVQAGARIQSCWSYKPPIEAALIEILSRALQSHGKTPCALAAAIEKAAAFHCQEMDDIVNPYGDRRGGLFESVWTIDLDQDVVVLLKEERSLAAPIKIVQERLLSLDDFEAFEPTFENEQQEQKNLPGPYWEPEMRVPPREKAFLGEVLRGFTHTWRHLLRRPMEAATFAKLAYGISRIVTMDFLLSEHTGFERSSGRGPYVGCTALPNWKVAEGNILQAGSSWISWSQSLPKALAMIKAHMETSAREVDSAGSEGIYAIMTPRHIILCKAHGEDLVWTKPALLIDKEGVIEDVAIDMLLWAANTRSPEPRPTTFHRFPVEIQDRILFYARVSLVGSARLGCELGLGTPSLWMDGGVRIAVQTHRRHRTEFSPVETQILFDGEKSGLSYKRAELYKWSPLLTPPPPQQRPIIASHANIV